MFLFENGAQGHQEAQGPGDKEWQLQQASHLGLQAVVTVHKIPVDVTASPMPSVFARLDPTTLRSAASCNNSSALITAFHGQLVPVMRTCLAAVLLVTLRRRHLTTVCRLSLATCLTKM